MLVGPILGAPINWFPLYLGPALVVEMLALTPLFKRPLVFGAVAGLGVGTVGLWLESLWIGAVYHYPWPISMWGEALAMAVPVAVLIGLCGALFGMVLTGQRLPGRAIGISVVVVTVLVIGGAVANGLHIVVPSKNSATITLTDLPSAPGQRMVSADVQLDPPDMVSDTSGLGDDPVLAGPHGTTTAVWSSTGSIKVGPGHYRSTQPVPVWGSWKTLLRVQDGYTMTAVPIWEPADDAIPAPEVPAAGVDHPAVRAGGHDPAARTRPERPGVVVHRRLDRGAVPDADGDRRPDLGGRPPQQRRHRAGTGRRQTADSAGGVAR